MSNLNESLDMLLSGAEVLIQAPGSSPKIEKTDIGIKDGKIACLNPSAAQKASVAEKNKFDLTGLTVFPGWIDSQVHFREPGLEHKEDLTDGSASAAMGGITAFFEMPNTKPNTTTEAEFAEKIKRARLKSHVDFAFYIGANGDNTSELQKLEKLEGCSGVKIFMGSSTGSLLVDSEESLDKILATVKRRPAIHAEDEARLKERRHLVEVDGATVHMHPVWRDETTALLATQRVLKLAKKNNRPVHVLHVTTAEEMDLLARNKDVATVEVTPQHLSLFAPDCYDRVGTLAQMNPPIREKHHQEALWKALMSGVVDVLGSDHAPHTFAEKQGVYPATPSGMPGVQTLPVLMLDHVANGRLDIFKLNDLLAVNPCRIWGFENRGYIQPGFDATFSIFDLKRKQEITPEWLKSKCGWSPFEGQTVQGWPIHTIIRGEFAMQDGNLTEFRGKPLVFTK